MLPASQAKIERAEEHIYNLEPELDAFLATNPNSVITEYDSQAGQWVFRFRVNIPTPLRFSVIVGEILHDLRSSLDHLACHLIRRKAGEGGITKSSGFPVSQTAKDFKSVLCGKVKGARAEVMQILEQIQPYPGGNGDGIWRLHEANIEDKHKLLVAVGCRCRNYSYDPVTSISPVAGMQSQTWVVTGVPQVTMEDGAEILRIDRSLCPEPDNTYQFTFQVAFGQPEILKGNALLPTLTQFVGLTKNTIMLFDGYV